MISKSENKNRNGFWKNPKIQSYMNDLATASYDDAMRMIYTPR